MREDLARCLAALPERDREVAIPAFQVTRIPFEGTAEDDRLDGVTSISAPDFVTAITGDRPGDELVNVAVQHDWFTALAFALRRALHENRFGEGEKFPPPEIVAEYVNSSICAAGAGDPEVTASTVDRVYTKLAEELYLTRSRGPKGTRVASTSGWPEPIDVEPLPAVPTRPLAPADFLGMITRSADPVITERGREATMKSELPRYGRRALVSLMDADQRPADSAGSEAAPGQRSGAQQIPGDEASRHSE